MTVVRREARRRWLTVLAVVCALGALPVAVQAWPVRAPAVDVQVLRERMRASADQPYQGYAVSSATTGLPPLLELDQVGLLASGTTQLRAWYAARDRWRVDVINPGNERGLYQTRRAQYRWDYGDNQLTRIVGEQPVRLPYAADLTPPELARRLLATATGERVGALSAKRVAGIAAAGLRIIPTAAHTSVAHVDIWADAATGVPLQTEITGRGADRPVLVSRFLQVQLTAPPPDVLSPPTPRAEMGFTTTRTPDMLSALERVNLGPLPDQLVGQPRRNNATRISSAGVYGDGLAQYVVLPVPGRIGYEAYNGAAKWGRRVTLSGADAALITTTLVCLLVVKSDVTGRTYLLAGMVDGDLLARAGAELSGFRA